MIYTINQGKHRAWPPIFGVLLKTRMSRGVTFDKTAGYDLPVTEDNEDINKLFGFGFFKGGHHEDSARFGWNYNQITGRVRLFAYCYVNGVRSMQEMAEILPYTRVRLTIQIYGHSRYVFTIHDGYNNWTQIGFHEVVFNHTKKWKYKLGCYFGGNLPAPHDIIIKISKK
jgi:hypothetical protein